MWINFTKDEIEMAVRVLRQTPRAEMNFGAHPPHDLADRLEADMNSREDPDDQKWVSAANERYLSCGPTDGDIDIDSDAVVSDGDTGAYVMMWGWIRNSEVGLPDEDEDDEG